MSHVVSGPDVATEQADGSEEPAHFYPPHGIEENNIYPTEMKYRETTNIISEGAPKISTKAKEKEWG